MSTLKDVAKKSGLSLTTVATILRGEKDLYQSETIRRVEEAAASLGYVPNHFSRNLVKGKTGILLYALSLRGGATFNRESELSLAEATAKSSFKLLIEPVDESGRPPEDAGFLNGRYFDGVIANFTSWTPEDMDRVEKNLERAGIPLVWFNQEREVNAVYPDEKADAVSLARFLFQKKYRSLLYVGHAPVHHHFSSRERYHSFQSEWSRLGGAFREVIAPLNPDISKSHENWKQNLAALKDVSAAFDCAVFSHAFLAPLFLSLTQAKLPLFSFDVPAPSWGSLAIGGQRIPWEELGRASV
ncbi:MAG: LacI family DNA-binding transcriptional regulator, partial [Spirochaetia bacterium]|nr:LacI family DNA-binding transcriptional regulator [Spirochaetia bacterium]